MLEFGVNDNSEGPHAGARWTVNLGPQQAGTAQVVLLDCGNWGRPAVVTVTGPEGTELARQEVSAPWEGAVRRLGFVAQGEGMYTVRYAVPGPGPKGGRVAGKLYVVPEAQAPSGR